jgi:hypothetical protein
MKIKTEKKKNCCVEFYVERECKNIFLSFRVTASVESVCFEWSFDLHLIRLSE